MTGKLPGCYVVLAILAAEPSMARPAPALAPQPVLGSRSVPIIKVGDLRFRDLDRDGRLSRFEDWRVSPDKRAADLASRLSLAAKAGLMMHSHLPGIGNPLGFSTTGYDLNAARAQIVGEKVNSFITRLAVSPRVMAEQNNAAQAIAEQGPFAIPLTISTDPRHHFQYVLGASNSATGYSQWPETLGFASLRDPAVIRRFADVARQEYRATGINEALSPQADLLTEPRWPRGVGTFGSDPALTGRLVRAYTEGFQGGSNGVTTSGVLAVVKHWVGYGAGVEGFDGHNYYGRIARVAPDAFAAHVAPFLAAFAVKVGGVMPTYDIVRGPIVAGKPLEPVGAAFNRQLLTDLLRKTYGYDGIVLSDWNVTLDCTRACIDPVAPQPPETIAMPWGVESLTPVQRYAKAVAAGTDQFGGVHEPQRIVDGVQRGLIRASSVNASAVRILAAKFRLGLFENPFVDPAVAERTVGTKAVQMEAASVQARAQVLLQNRSDLLPVRLGARIFLRGVSAEAAQRSGYVVVARPEDADLALVRVSTPHEMLHPNAFFGSRQNEGRLDFRPGDPDFEAIKALSAKTRVVVALFADRPAVATAILPMASALLVNFGVSDEALLRSLDGREAIAGRLPYAFPSSMAAVVAQTPSVPDDDAAPLFRFGAGIDLPATSR